MTKKELIEQEIEKTLQAFDSAEQLPPNPYFYTRVQAGLEQKFRRRNIFLAVLRPALFAVIVILNIGTAVWYLSGEEQSGIYNSRNELVEILAGDLNLNDDQNKMFEIN